MTDAAALAQEFWCRMNTNQWSLAAELFADNIEIVWPQSGEVISSAEDFVALNAAYPANGKWQFSIKRLIGAGERAVTETAISDGTTNAFAVSIFECADDRIVKITEYWPEPYDAPDWRRAWVSARTD
ncbi:nuclear transport factor 2 family protein [Pelagibacterium sp.]|uniref:nuclear transport factor 2 family protein n=1 Tax=Pelagibacterium sp. TaxID=1967288 RepID=UPI003A93ADA7